MRTTNGKVNGSSVRLMAMVASAATATAERITSGRMARSGATATATTGGAESTISREATTMLWNACGSCAGLTIPNTAVKTPKPIAPMAMTTASTRMAVSRPDDRGCQSVMAVSRRTARSDRQQYRDDADDDRNPE